MDRREFIEQAFSAALVNGDFDVQPEQLARLVSVVNPERARNVFSVFRKSIRPGILWGPFVADLTYELSKFYKALVAGE
jgi:hypothetical protein